MLYMTRRARYVAVTSACLLMVVSLPGCGNDRPKTIPVSGRVTYGGGDWPTGGRLYFTSIEPAEGYIRRPGKAFFDADGNFRAGSWEESDGLVPGKYKVSVECWKTAPTMGGPPSESYVATEYQVAAKTPWEIEVTLDGGAVKLERDIPKPK